MGRTVMSQIGSLESFLGDRTFASYRENIFRLFEGYVDVRTEPSGALTFFTTTKGVWWTHGWEFTVTWPSRFEGPMEGCDFYVESAKGKVPGYMGTHHEPCSQADFELLARWQDEARARGIEPA